MNIFNNSNLVLINPLLFQTFTASKYYKEAMNDRLKGIRGGALEDFPEIEELVENDDIPDGAIISFTGTVDIAVRYSAAIRTYTEEFFGEFEKGDDVDIDQLVEDAVEEVVADAYSKYNETREPDDVEALYDTVEIDDVGFEDDGLEDMELNQQKVKIDSLFNEVIPNTEGHCVRSFMKKQYPMYKDKQYENLHTTKDIKEWCKKKKIKMIAYDIKGNVISKNIPDKRSGKKNCIFIAYCGHLYPLKNAVLHKKKKKVITDIKYTDDANDTLCKFIAKDKLPTNITLGKKGVYAFELDEDQYIGNDEFEDCKYILSLFGIEDKINPSTRYSNVCNILETLYIKSNINSFIPDNRRFLKGGYYYQKDCEDDIEELPNNFYEGDVKWEYETIDKNKSYSWNLTQLPYLIRTDIRCFDWKIIMRQEPTEDCITDHYLYIVKPKQSTILLPTTNIYSGLHLKRCLKEGLTDFLIQEELTTETTENYFKQMVLDLWEKVINKDITEYQFKFIMNAMIGRFEMNREIDTGKEFNKIVDSNEAIKSSGFNRPIGKGWFINWSKKNIFKIFNRKPIGVQVKDEARYNIYCMMKKLKLTNNDIVQVKTDSFTYIKRQFVNEETDVLNKEQMENVLNETDKFNGWKKESYKPFENVSVVDNEDLSFKSVNNKNIDNYLGNCYAGCGKSYTIMNTIIPKLVEEGHSYIVLTPSHSCLTEYRKKGFNCNVIQRFQFCGKIPDEEYVIVDEFGMVGNCGLNVIYKCYIAGKKIIAYGDFKQLKAVDGKTYDKELWIDMIFNKKIEIDTNYRNTFSREYYDSLINSNNITYLSKEVKKHSTKSYKDAELIICYRNEVCKNYNEKMCEHLGLTDITDIGCKVMCRTNDLRAYNIYNKYLFTVKGMKDNLVVLNDTIEDYEIPEEEYRKNFDFGYARTIYSIQGESIKSYYFAFEDQRFLDGRVAYTIISRLKNK